MGWGPHNSRRPPPCPSPTACRSLSSMSVFLTSLGPRGTVRRLFSVDSRVGLPARAGERRQRGVQASAHLAQTTLAWPGLLPPGTATYYNLT